MPKEHTHEFPIWITIMLTIKLLSSSLTSYEYAYENLVNFLIMLSRFCIYFDKFERIINLSIFNHAHEF